MFTGAEICAEITTLARYSLPALSIHGHMCGAPLHGGVKAAQLPASSGQHSMARHGMAQGDVAWHGVAWHGTAQHTLAWHGMMWCGMTRRSMARHSQEDPRDAHQGEQGHVSAAQPKPSPN